MSINKKRKKLVDQNIKNEKKNLENKMGLWITESNIYN